MKLKLILCLCMLPLFCLAQEAQPQQFSNRYGMKMTQNEDGSYALLYAKKYAKFIDVNTIPDVMVPYTYQPDRLKSKDYKGVATKDIVYKKHKDYELILTVDLQRLTNPLRSWSTSTEVDGHVEIMVRPDLCLNTWQSKRVLQVYVSLIHWHRNPTQP